LSQTEYLQPAWYCVTGENLVAEKAPNRDGYNVIERKCRIVMDVMIRISGITPESVAEYFTPDETGEGLPWEWAERQNRLLLAIMKDEEVLEQFLVSIAADDLGALLESKQVGGLSDEEEDELFEKVYSRMDSEDALYFREARSDRSLYHNIELVHRAFVTEWKGAKLIKVRVLKARDEAG
jgi:hypothetical protein